MPWAGFKKARKASLLLHWSVSYDNIKWMKISLIRMSHNRTVPYWSVMPLRTDKSDWRTDRQSTWTWKEVGKLLLFSETETFNGTGNKLFCLLFATVFFFPLLTLFSLQRHGGAKFCCVKRVGKRAYPQLNGQKDTPVNKLSMSLPRPLCWHRHHPLDSASCWIPFLLRGKTKILRAANIQPMSVLSQEATDLVPTCRLSDLLHGTAEANETTHT
jgi:hypothetical protein